MGSSKGPKRDITPAERPSFIMGSRPANMRAPMPGSARIKPAAAGTRDYGKISGGPAVGTFAKDQGPV